MKTTIHIFSRLLFSLVAVAFFSISISATVINSTLDAVAPPPSSGYTNPVTGLMPTQRINRDGVVSRCGVVKPNPGVIAATNLRYDAFTFTAAVSRCVTVSVRVITSGSEQVHVAAYSNFDPSNVSFGYLADSGSSSSIAFNPVVSFSMNVTAGQSYTIVAFNPFAGEGVQYELTVNDHDTVTSDFDGDGYADATVFRASAGVFYSLRSATNTVSATPFGTTGDIPLDGDFDGDGRTDVAIYRPGAGQWWIRKSMTGQTFVATFGQAGDKPVPSDQDKDGITDIAFFRPGSGTWYVLRSSSNFNSFYAFPFGASGDLPVGGAINP